MFSKINSIDELNSAISFVKTGCYNCPYLYTNINKYGYDSDRVIVYTNSNGDSIYAVALLYYDCLHVFYHDNYKDFNELQSFINELKPRTIYIPNYNTIDMPAFEEYTVKDALVMAPKQYLDIDVSMVKNASLDDISRIADFMYTQWPDVYESAEMIYKQVRERMEDGYGRTKYYEDDGEIVACVSSFAELDDFSICSGLLVAESQRGKKLGSVMLKSIYEELDKEGKRPCGVIVDDYSRIFHEKNGFVQVGRMAKYYRKIKN